MRAACVLVLLAAGPSCLHALQVGQAESMAHTGNPIRKVVNMLTSMSKKVEAEGEQEEELYHKFMCLCKTGTGDLEKSISDAQTKVPQLESSIKELASQKAQLDGDIVKHKEDRAAAKKTMAEATSIRNREAAAHAKEASEAQANIAATAKAVKALEGGMASSFLQSGVARSLLSIVQSRDKMDDSDREFVTSFLDGSQRSDASSPGSMEIAGILKTMNEDMAKDLKEAVDAEKTSIADFDDLIGAKTKEVTANGKAIEEKVSRSGELAVEKVQQKDDLSDTSDQLAEDTKMVANLKKNCGTKTADFEAAQKARSDELVALADTVKILNDDDALDLFKKTLPSGASFMQVEDTIAAMRKRAFAIVHQRPRLDFIALAVHGKKTGFEVVIKMVDEMAATLKKEQVDDDKKRDYCTKQFDTADDKKRSLERSIADVKTVIANSKDGVANLQDEIKTLGDGITALDEATAEATVQRKKENGEFTSLMVGNQQAKEIMNMAKNRLNQFYHPKMAVLLQRFHVEGKATTKSRDSTGVIAMIDLLIADITKEMTIAKVEEKDSQGDYEQTMQDSADKRAGDLKSLAGKEKTLADLKADLEASNESKSSSTKELSAQMEYIKGLHGECDWLLQYYDTRKEARASEVDALNKAKAVLNGADYSLMQVKSSRKLLRRA